MNSGPSGDVNSDTRGDKDSDTRAGAHDPFPSASRIQFPSVPLCLCCTGGLESREDTLEEEGWGGEWLGKEGSSREPQAGPGHQSPRAFSGQQLTLLLHVCVSPLGRVLGAWAENRGLGGQWKPDL